MAEYVYRDDHFQGTRDVRSCQISTRPDDLVRGMMARAPSMNQQGDAMTHAFSNDRYSHHWKWTHANSYKHDFLQ